jgi:diaminohydroxyphosphoribosylaminopyrimidine deaminase/5-amino-6-(5-phosphoribosylamino)uracil reductase
VDKVALFLAPKVVGEGKGFLEGVALSRMAEAYRLRLARREWLGEDLWLEGYLEV